MGVPLDHNTRGGVGVNLQEISDVNRMLVGVHQGWWGLFRGLNIKHECANQSRMWTNRGWQGVDWYDIVGLVVVNWGYVVWTRGWRGVLERVNRGVHWGLVGVNKGQGGVKEVLGGANWGVGRCEQGDSWPGTHNRATWHASPKLALSGLHPPRDLVVWHRERDGWGLLDWWSAALHQQSTASSVYGGSWCPGAKTGDLSQTHSLWGSRDSRTAPPFWQSLSQLRRARACKYLPHTQKCCHLFNMHATYYMQRKSSFRFKNRSLLVCSVGHLFLVPNFGGT